MPPTRTRHRLAVLVSGLVLIAACSSSSDDAGSDAGASDDATSTTAAADVGYPLDDELRLNEIQVLGSHNSYHLQAGERLFAGLMAFLPAVATTLEYSHVPLDQQFSDQGIRQIELDIYYDPEGGRYAERKGPPAVGLPSASGIAALDEPGMKVLHVPDVDFETSCVTLVECLEQVRDWSDDNPGHVPMMVLVETKQDPTPDPLSMGFVVPLPFDAEALDAIDAEILSVFDRDQIVTPDDVRGDHDSLEDAVLAGDWPTLGASRGKVMFGMIQGGAARELYLEGHAGLEGRVMFTRGEPGQPDAAFLMRDDPIAEGDTIRSLVEQGYIIRTRADADTNEARSGDITKREAAFASGAQFVSTDYADPDERFSDYSVRLPGGTPARCNPIIAPANCTSEAVEDPASLKDGS